MSMGTDHRRRSRSGGSRRSRRTSVKKVHSRGTRSRKHRVTKSDKAKLAMYGNLSIA